MLWNKLTRSLTKFNVSSGTNGIDGALDNSNGCVPTDANQDLKDMYSHETMCIVDNDEYRKVLLEMLDVCASHALNDRSLVREILTALYWVTGRIERDVLYWDCDVSHNQAHCTQERLKRQYVLEQVAGWAIDPTQQPWNRNTQANYYLDLPFAKAPGQPGHSETQIISDALYHKQDPQLVLCLLRHGVQASCLYLWPVAMTLDLRLTLHDEPCDTDQVSTWKEMEYIRYFNRARGNYTIQVVKGEESDNISLHQPSYDDTLLLPSRVKDHIPDKSFREPVSLQHNCRLSIRRSLLVADNLPRGISQLPLPRTLTSFLDLEED